MNFFYYALGGIIAYFAADWLLNKIEEARGKLFKERSVVFFFIIFALAFLIMSIFSPLLQPPPPTPETSMPTR